MQNFYSKKVTILDSCDQTSNYPVRYRGIDATVLTIHVAQGAQLNPQS